MKKNIKGNIKKNKILLVDDDEIHLSIAETILKDTYEIVAVRSGKEALDYLIQGNLPNLVLLDILMPNMNGWETYNTLRGISLLQDVPIAFLTSLHGIDEEKHAHEIGAADYIMKPYSREDLLKRVAAIIEKNEYTG